MSLRVKNELLISDDTNKIFLNGNNLLLRGNNVDNVEIGSTFVDIGSNTRFDTVNQRLGINNLTPTYNLDVSGDSNITGTYRISGTSVLNSTTLGSGIINSSLTSLGTLTGLTMGGNLNMGTNNIINATNITGTNLTGTLQTAAQTNITSVGTLTSLTVSGNLTVDTNTLFVNSTNNRIGVGTLIPTETLEVQGVIKPNGEDDSDISNPFGSGGTYTRMLQLNERYSIGTITNDYLMIGRNGGGAPDPDMLVQFDVNGISANGNFNTLTGSYQIGGISVLTSNTLGSGIINSSLTSLGTLSSLTVSGDLTVDTNTFYIDSVNNRVGIINLIPSYPLDVTGDINSSSNYRIAGTSVLTSNTLGSGIVNSSLTSVGTLSSLTVTNNINTISGLYQIGGVSVLTSNTLGTGIINSSLTSVGTLTSLNVSGNMTVDTNTFYVDSINNRVGILTTSPGNALEVNGVARINGIDDTAITNDFGTGTTYKRMIQFDSGRYSIGMVGTEYLSIGRNGGAGDDPKMIVHVSNTGVDIRNDFNTLFGSYKIGGASVLTSTTLGSGIVNSSLTSVGTLSSLNISGDLTVDTNTLFVDSVNNRVGINDLTPSYALDVTGDINSTTALRINGNAIVSGNVLGGSITQSSLTTLGTLTSLTVSGDVIIDTNTLIVDSTNNRVGIGITNPVKDLQVNGDIRGNIIEALTQLQSDNIQGINDTLDIHAIGDVASTGLVLRNTDGLAGGETAKIEIRQDQDILFSTNGVERLQINNTETISSYPILGKNPIMSRLGTSPQSIPQSIDTVVLAATSSVSYGSVITYSAGVFTVSTAGLYFVQGQVVFDQDNDNYRQIMIVHKSSSGTLKRKIVNSNQAAGGIDTYTTITSYINCSGGDKITIEVRQQSGGNRTISQSSSIEERSQIDIYMVGQGY